MPDRDTLLLFIAAALALNVTPGPDMLYVIGRSMADGLRAGIVSAFGISAGILIHIAALAAGIATLLVANPIAYDAIRIGGAIYLGWLGIAAFRRAGNSTVSPGPGSAPWRNVFAQGVLTSTLNPKIALFFLALLPQFTDPARGNPARQVVVLGLLFVTSGTTTNLLVAWGVARSVSRFGNDRPESALRFGQHLKRVTGSLFIVLAVRMAMLGR